VPNSDPVHKVSIVARGRALGWTQLLPTEDRYTRTRNELIDDLAVFMGGLSAEELIFDERTTGASDDIERATRVARAMVTEYGMSDELGPQKFGHRLDEPFLGREHAHQADYSDEIAGRIDAEIKRLLDEAHQRARVILTTHRAVLDELATVLIERETLDEDELTAVFAEIDPLA
jgi:cell division protease FtsH